MSVQPTFQKTIIANYSDNKPIIALYINIVYYLIKIKKSKINIQTPTMIKLSIF